MPLAAFTPENEVKSSTLFPRLKLNKDEYARIVFLDTAPEYRWVHELKMPKLENGEAVKVVKERKDKSTYEAFDMDFINADQCFGDDALMQEKGFDVEHCPACARAKAGGDTIPPAIRLLALHIFKYGTVPGTDRVAEPFQGTVLVWRFKDNMFSKLVSIAQEHGPLQRLDLKLKCISGQFQTYDVSPGGAGKAEWLMADNPPATGPNGEPAPKLQARYKFVAAAFAAAKEDGHELEAFLGRKQDRAGMMADINRVDERWRIVNGVSAPTNGAVAGVGTGNLASEFDDLLSQSADTAVAPAAPVEATGDPFAGGTPLPENAPPASVPQAAPIATPAPAAVAPAPAQAPAAAPVAVAAPAAPAPQGETVQFDDLLAGLDI